MDVVLSMFVDHSEHLDYDQESYVPLTCPDEFQNTKDQPRKERQGVRGGREREGTGQR